MSVETQAMQRASTSSLSSGDAVVPAAGVRTGVVLGAMVCVAALLHTVLALRSPAPWVMPDELRWAELAKSLGAGDAPGIRGETTFGFGLGYPLLLAPIWAITDNVETVYVASKVLNSVVLALTAVPAFFLARRFLDDVRALVAAALCICIPSLLYAGTLMSEVALYPAFTLGLLAVAIALERPTMRAQVGALAAILMASLIKVTALSLLFAYLAAILLSQWLASRERAEPRLRLRNYRLTWLALGASIVLGGVLGFTRGISPLAALGEYREAVTHTDFVSLPWWALLHVAAFDLFVAIIPFAATAVVIVQGLRRGADSRVRRLSVLALTTGVSLFGAVSLYAADAREAEFGYLSGAGANERYTFMLAPLAFIGLMLVLKERRSLQGWVLVTAFCAVVLPAVIPLDSFQQRGNLAIQAFALVPWVGSGMSPTWPFGVLVLTSALGALFVFASLRPIREAWVIAPVALVLMSVTMIAQYPLELSSRWSRSVSLGASPGWVDSIAKDEAVSVLWYEVPGEPYVLDPARHRVLWVNEFFNRSIGRVFELGSPVAFGSELKSTPVKLVSGRVVLQNGARPDLGRLVFAPCQVHVKGQVVARDTQTGAAVYRVAGDVRVHLTNPARCRVS